LLADLTVDINIARHEGKNESKALKKVATKIAILLNETF
jgi:hypothetical protein